MDDRSVWHSLWYKETVSLRKGLCLTVSGKIDGSFDDKLPLVPMRMLWYQGFPVEFHEHDLFMVSLNEVTLDTDEREVDFWAFFDTIRERAYHGNASWKLPRMFNPIMVFKVSVRKDATKKIFYSEGCALIMEKRLSRNAREI